MLRRARIWDYSAAQRPDAIAANSRFVSERLWRIHKRNAKVIYPPVTVDVPFGSRRDEGYYLSLGRLVPYKRVDLLARAFARMPNRRLKIVGTGPEKQRITSRVTPNVEMLGYQPQSAVRSLLAGACAYVFAGIEDFGISAVEAQAAGTPVIAYRGGGLTETVNGPESSRPTGLFFGEQTEDAIVQAVEQFESTADRFTAEACRENAERFDAARFPLGVRRFVNSAIAAQAATMSERVRRESAPVAPRLLESDNAVTTFAAAPMHEADARHGPSDVALGERELATR